jgi:ATP-dependent exoDNAse (exonuclease V) beta subunit
MGMLELVLNRDIEIFFDEPTHKYTDQYNNEYTSVTTLIHKYVPVFDKEYWAKRKSKELRKSVHTIKKEWDDINKNSTDKGTSVHNKLESSIKKISKFNKNIKTINTSKGSRVFSINDIDNVKFGTNVSLKDIQKIFKGGLAPILPTLEYYINKGYKIYSEINVFHPVYLISGTIDLPLFNGTDFVIIDWKTNRNDIYFESGYFKKDGVELTNKWVKTSSKLKYPLHFLDDCTGVHYSLQLSLYAIMLECFGYVCRGLILFHIRDPYVLNSHGMPLKDDKGFYIIDENKPKNIQRHVLVYYKKYVTDMVLHYYKDKVINNQYSLNL